MLAPAGVRDLWIQYCKIDVSSLHGPWPIVSGFVHLLENWHPMGPQAG
ncbi:hypothetical protein TPY_2561 [Sulfobacillus acidophilus TPY]|nr:hypothetical protein TPY_2561 [Sulfobacillus acidophilus TPY]